MADTKKEHYVPRCYLENFACNSRVEVFDKWKLQVRKQRIMDIAMENGFYDMNLLKMIDELEVNVSDKLKKDLMKIVKTESWEDVEKIIGNEKYIEKEHFSVLEGAYSPLLKSIINKGQSANNWVMKNCYAFSETEKDLLSVFIAIQIIRTKRFRETLNDIMIGTSQALANKIQFSQDEFRNTQPVEVSVHPDVIKFQHSKMILDSEMELHLAQILNKHIWIMCVNTTEVPFYTSDTPVVKIPHKVDKYISYAGFASEGIEIALPITPTLMICMYDSEAYNKLFKDRQYYEIKDVEEVKYYNSYQIANSYRCVFSKENKFDMAMEYCKKYPDLQKYRSEVEVL